MRFLRIFWLPEMKSTHLFWLDGISLVKIGLEKLRFVSVEMCREVIGVVGLIVDECLQSYNQRVDCLQ